MRKRIVVCDNCGGEMRGRGNVQVGTRKFDVCESCIAGVPVDLATLDPEAWPKLVRSADVQAYLTGSSETAIDDLSEALLGIAIDRKTPVAVVQAVARLQDRARKTRV